MLRVHAKQCAVVAHLTRHPNGQWTHQVAAALGIPEIQAGSTLSWLHRTGRVERQMLPDRRGRGKSQRYARWYPCPGAAEPEVAKRQSCTAHYAPDFHPDPDHWGEHERWQARVTAPKVRYNPWARA
jgi:hypothetical protein